MMDIGRYIIRLLGFVGFLVCVFVRLLIRNYWADENPQGFHSLIILQGSRFAICYRHARHELRPLAKVTKVNVKH